MVGWDILHPIRVSLEKRIVYLSSSGSSGFPFTPLLLLLQRLAQCTVDVPGLREEVIRAREPAATVEAARVAAVRAVEASAQEATVAQESATVLVKEAEDQAALVEREARERVSRMEADFLPSRGCVGSPFWSPNHARRTSVADEWAWSPLAVSGAPSSPGGEHPTTLGTPRTIPGVGL
jgi:hypothetical protein